MKADWDRALKEFPPSCYFRSKILRLRCLCNDCDIHLICVSLITLILWGRAANCIWGSYGIILLCSWFSFWCRWENKDEDALSKLGANYFFLNCRLIIQSDRHTWDWAEEQVNNLPPSHPCAICIANYYLKLAVNKTVCSTEISSFSNCVFAPNRDEKEWNWIFTKLQKASI